MKTFIFFFLFLLTQPNYSNAQYTCDELVDAVKKSLNPSDKFATNSSSLIYKAELYDYEGIYIVIADFKSGIGLRLKVFMDHMVRLF